MPSKFGGFFAHPAWAGIGALASVLALFFAGFGQQTVDKVVHYFSAEATPLRNASAHAGQKSGYRGQRIALVIGNQDYKNAGKLGNPLSDTNLIAETLHRLDFKVIKKANLDYEQMKQSINDFQTILSSGGIGLVYYAGHAAYVDVEDILFPIDVDSESYEQVNEAAKTRNLVPARQPTKFSDVIYLNDLLKPVDKIFE